MGEMREVQSSDLDRMLKGLNTDDKTELDKNDIMEAIHMKILHQKTSVRKQLRQELLASLITLPLLLPNLSDPQPRSFFNSVLVISFTLAFFTLQTIGMHIYFLFRPLPEPKDLDMFSFMQLSRSRLSAYGKQTLVNCNILLVCLSTTILLFLFKEMLALKLLFAAFFLVMIPVNEIYMRKKYTRLLGLFDPDGELTHDKDLFKKKI